MQTTECVIAWLCRFRDNENALDNLLERITALRSRLKSPKNPVISGMPHGGGYEGDSIGRGLAKIEELENQAQDFLKISQELYSEINSAIDSISGREWANRRCVLRCRYLDGFQWVDICEILFGRKSDFEEKQESYLRRCFRIHGDAIEELRVIVPDFTGTENNTGSEDTGK